MKHGLLKRRIRNRWIWYQTKTTTVVWSICLVTITALWELKTWEKVTQLFISSGSQQTSTQEDSKVTMESDCLSQVTFLFQHVGVLMLSMFGKFSLCSFSWSSALQVQLIRSPHHNRTDMKCHSSCSLPGRPAYIWFNRGQEVKGQTSDHLSANISGGNFSCAVRGHQEFSSASVWVFSLSASVWTSAKFVSWL